MRQQFSAPADNSPTGIYSFGDSTENLLLASSHFVCVGFYLFVFRIYSGDSV